MKTAKINTSYYYYLLPKLNKGAVFTKFQKYLVDKDIKTKEDCNEEVKKIFLELLMISVTEEEVLNKDNFEEYIPIWRDIFPHLEIRLATTEFFNFSQLSALKELFDVTQSTIKQFKKQLEKIIWVSEFRVTSYPQVVLEAPESLITTSATFEFFTGVVPLDMPSRTV